MFLRDRKRKDWSGGSLSFCLAFFFVLKNPRHVFAETTRSKWLEKYLARSVDRGPPLPQACLNFNPQPLRRDEPTFQIKQVAIGADPGGVINCGH